MGKRAFGSGSVRARRQRPASPRPPLRGLHGDRPRARSGRDPARRPALQHRPGRARRDGSGARHREHGAARIAPQPPTSAPIERRPARRPARPALRAARLRRGRRAASTLYCGTAGHLQHGPPAGRIADRRPRAHPRGARAASVRGDVTTVVEADRPEVAAHSTRPWRCRAEDGRRRHLPGLRADRAAPRTRRSCRSSGSSKPCSSCSSLRSCRSCAGSPFASGGRWRRSSSAPTTTSSPGCRTGRSSATGSSRRCSPPAGRGRAAVHAARPRPLQGGQRRARPRDRRPAARRARRAARRRRSATDETSPASAATSSASSCRTASAADASAIARARSTTALDAALRARAGFSLEVGASIGDRRLSASTARTPTRCSSTPTSRCTSRRSAHAGTAVYDAEQDANDAERLALAGELRRAIENEELVLHYQPKADARDRPDRRRRGARPLAASRARLHPAGRVHPDRRAHRADQAARAATCSRAALRQCARVGRRAGLDLHVAVNLRSADLLDLELPGPDRRAARRDRRPARASSSSRSPRARSSPTRSASGRC